MKTPALLLLAAIATLSTGCATITRGSTQAITITSQPTGATVSMSNGERCETPCTRKFKRKFSIALEICKAGYKTVNTDIKSQIAGAGAAGMAGNVIFGGLIGVGVDVATGATKELKPNPLLVSLEAESPGCAAPNYPAVPDGGQKFEKYKRIK